MSDRSFQRREYRSWEEAFRGLVPAIRQESVRVASYSQVLFVQACGASFGKGSSEGAERMKRKYADFIYKCGLYHQLGKAVMPADYQVYKEAFDEQELAIYQKYPIEGKELVSKLQEPKKKFTVKRKASAEGKTTEDITWLMLREVCEQHMERYDGSGFPYGLHRNDISVVAQIVGLAKEFDRIASNTISEDPFEDAYSMLTAESGKLFSPELIDIFVAAKDKCADVFKKYIHYTKALEKTIPLVEKRVERPLGLKYYPVLSIAGIKEASYQAVPWFKGIVDRPDDTDGVDKLEDMLMRTGNMADIYLYFLYELTDTLLRMKNCNIETAGIILETPAGYFEGADLSNNLDQLFVEQPVDKNLLMLTVPEKAFTSGNEKVRENVVAHIEKGYHIMVDNYHPGEIPFKEVVAMGIKYVRLAADVQKTGPFLTHIEELKDTGAVLVGSIDKKFELTEQDIITKGLENRK